MKGKIRFMWRATLALVLVLSLGVVMAVPVSATHTSTATVAFHAEEPTVTGEASILDVTVTNNAASAGNITSVEIDFTASDFTVTGVGLEPASWSGDLVGSVVTYTYATGIAPAASVIFAPAVTNPTEAGPAAVPAVLTTDAGSQAALAAAVNTGWIAYEADSAGAGGNDITVEYVDPGMVSQATISVSVVVKAITVSLQTDAGGAVISTAAEVDSAIDSNTPADALVDATADAGHETYVVQPLVVPAFTGGTSPDVDKVCTVTPATLTITGLVPIVSTVSPVKGNVGDTMWVEVTGENFTGTATTNVSSTTFDFGAGITVVSRKFIGPTEIDVQIEINATGTPTVVAATAAGTGTVGQTFTANAAGIAQVDVWNAYTPTDDPFVTGTLDFQETTATIQTAITAATTDDVLIVHAGTYEEDLVIPATGKDNLELAGASGATIKGVGIGPGPEFPFTVPNIDILADGVTIHGFTIESPDAVVDKYASGLLIGAKDVEIYENDFKVHTQDTGQYSVVIQTWRKVVAGFESVNISGLKIYDNTFDDLGDGTVGYDGIYVNIDTGTEAIAIEDNDFTGSLFRAISVERSNVVISGNTIVTDLPPWTSGYAGGYQGMFIGSFIVETAYPAQSDVSVTGNTVKGATTSEGFAQGIRVGHTLQSDLSNMVVSGNTVQDCDEGITVRADASGVMVKYNDITGNTVGVQNDHTADTLNAKYNWWGHISGPSTDPAATTATALGQGDVVSAYVIYDPWLTRVQATAVSDGIAYHGDTYPLEAGWNTLSVPLALDDGADTLNDIVALGDFFVTSGTDQNYLGGYYYDIVNTLWVPIPGAYEFAPCKAVYVKMAADASFPVLYSGVFSLPTLSLSAGWNLIGSAFGIDKGTESDDYGIAAFDDEDGDGKKAVDEALASLGANASVVISPSMPGQTLAWATTIGGTAQDMIVGEGYWVFMTAPATLAGFEVTPIYWIFVPSP